MDVFLFMRRRKCLKNFPDPGIQLQHFFKVMRDDRGIRYCFFWWWRLYTCLIKCYSFLDIGNQLTI